LDTRDRDEICGGIPFFPQRERQVDLELVETRRLSSRVVYRVVR
jgi:hypothetical protein